MKIVHHLKKENNFSYLLNCPICGSDFKELQKLRAIEDAKNRIKLIENKSQIVNDELNTTKIFNFNCSNCTFEIEYHLPVAIQAIEVNEDIKYLN